MRCALPWLLSQWATACPELSNQAGCKHIQRQGQVQCLIKLQMRAAGPILAECRSLMLSVDYDVL